MKTTSLGQRQTRQRDAILKVLTEANGPLSVPEIFALAKKKIPLGIATVYRAVNLLLTAREIQSVILPSGETRYESADLGHHDHFQCRNCGHVFDLSVCPLHLASGTIIPGGFLVEDHEMTLYGLCPDCTGKSAKKRPAKAAKTASKKHSHKH
jgi:Fur family ferric uptake transcriptional regulator